VLEIVAPIGLRATFGLGDGDEVTVEVLAGGTTSGPQSAGEAAR
jgi:hypothetical protein